MRLKRWVRVVLTLLVIHLSFYVWKQTGILGELAQQSKFYLILCIISWFYLIIGQTFIYSELWENKKIWKTISNPNHCK